MIFYIGIAIIFAGLLLMVLFLVKINRPKEKVIIDTIEMAYLENDKMQTKLFRHGRVRYSFRSVNYEALVYLLKRNANVGDEITISFKENQPNKPIMFAPRQEIITSVVVTMIGIGVVSFAFSMAEKYFN